MARQGIDYSWHPALDVDAFRAAGKTFVVRYLSHTPGKNLTPSEARLLSEGGLDIAVVWESSKARALSGQDGGVADADHAAEQAEACGMPDGRPIYFAVDFNAGDSQKPAIADYLRGAATVLGPKRVGVYGGYRVVKYCLDNSVAEFGWQTYAWSGGQRDQRAHLYQRLNGVAIGKVSCDLDTAYAADFGQWRVPLTAPPPFPYPAPDFLGTGRPDPHCHSGSVASEREHIAKWQAKMAERGWAIPITGVFGNQSDRICRSFQSEKGLDVDGLVGALTWAKTWSAPVTLRQPDDVHVEVSTPV